MSKLSVDLVTSAGLCLRFSWFSKNQSFLVSSPSLFFRSESIHYLVDSDSTGFSVYFDNVVISFPVSELSKFREFLGQAQVKAAA